MRIDFNARTPEVPMNDRPRASAGQTGPAAASGAQDEAQLSGYTRVQALEAELQLLPDTRQDRVATITQQLREGRYQASPEQIADSMFSEMAAKAALIR